PAATHRRFAAACDCSLHVLRAFVANRLVYSVVPNSRSKVSAFSASSAVNVPMNLIQVRQQIVSCELCPRLRDHCQRVAREKRKAFRDETYWAKPVPGFGDPNARLLLIGLAPAAHGANRTGRVFTGDGVGGSGDFLMAALHRAGFSNITTSRHPDDGLK